MIEITVTKSGARTRIAVPEGADVAALLERCAREFSAPITDKEQAERDARFAEMMAKRSQPEPAPKREKVVEVEHPKKKVGVRDTSMEAHRRLLSSGKLGAQQRQIVEHFLANPKRKLTRQEIARDTKLSINATCGRIAELMAEPFGVLHEVGRKRCSVTSQSVNAISLVGVQ